MSNKQDANKFLDTLGSRLGAKNDAALARMLEVQPPVISKLRHGKIFIGATMLVRAHDLTKLPISVIRTWAEAA